MGEFRHRDLQSSDPAALRRELNAELRAIELELAALRSRGTVSAVQVTDYSARYGDVVRVAPPSSGLRVILPPPIIAQAGKASRVVVVVEGEAGALTVEAVETTVNGADTLTFAAGIGVVELALTETGWYCWSATMVADLPLSAVEDQPALSVAANATNATAPLTAVTSSSNDTFFQRVSNVLQWGTLTLGMAAANLWTYAKLQQVSATARILGRYTAGAGNIEEGTITQALDLAGSTRGAVPLRGAATWAVLAPGTATHVLTSNGAGADPSYQAPPSASDTARGDIEIAVDSEMESATDTVRAVVPGRLHRHPGVAKFWVHVVNAASTPAINGSYNVTSITDTATGRLTVTIATDFSSATTWIPIVCTLQTGGVAMISAVNDAPTAGAVEVANWVVGGALTDPSRWYVCGFGDHA